MVVRTLLVAACLLAGSGPNREVSGIASKRSRPPVHDVHLSYGRLVVEPTALTFRVRVFHDDWSRALAKRAGRDTVDLADRSLADSLAERYLAEAVAILADGSRLEGTLTGGGPEDKMWWYQLRYPLRRPARALSIANRVLFEAFADQQNIVKVVGPEGKEENLYFVPHEPGPVTVTLR